MATDVAKEANKLIEQSKTDIKNAANEASKDFKKTIKAVGKQSVDQANETIASIQKVAAETVKKESEQITNTVNNTDVIASAKSLFGKGYVSTLVNNVLDKSVEKMLDEQIAKGQLSLKTSEIGKTYATAEMYYKKLYDMDTTILSLRDKAETTVSKSINRSINDKIAAWQNGLPEWQRKLLANSKICSSITNLVNVETKNCIDAIFTNAAITKYSTKMVKSIKDLETHIKTVIATKYKNELAYMQKLKKAVQDKLKKYQEIKERYEKLLKEAVDAFKKKITDALTQWTQKLVTSITSATKINVGCFG